MNNHFYTSHFVVRLQWSISWSNFEAATVLAANRWVQCQFNKRIFLFCSSDCESYHIRKLRTTISCPYTNYEVRDECGSFDIVTTVSLTALCHLKFHIKINIRKRVRLLVEIFLSDAAICDVPVVAIYETAVLHDMIRHYCGGRVVYDDVVRSDWNTMSVVTRLDPVLIRGTAYGLSKVMFISIYDGESIFIKKALQGEKFSSIHLRHLHVGW